MKSFNVPPLAPTCSQINYFVPSGVTTTAYEWKREFGPFSHSQSLSKNNSHSQTSQPPVAVREQRCLCAWPVSSKRIQTKQKLKIDATRQLFTYSRTCSLYCTGSNQSKPAMGVLQLWCNSVPSGGSNSSGWAMYCWATERAVFGMLLPEERSSKQMEKRAEALTRC